MGPEPEGVTPSPTAIVASSMRGNSWEADTELGGKSSRIVVEVNATVSAICVIDAMTATITVRPRSRAVDIEAAQRSRRTPPSELPDPSCHSGPLGPVGTSRA